MKFDLLSSIASYRNKKISAKTLQLEDYISTENMLPNKSGIVLASSIPQSGSVAAYSEGDILISNIRPYFKKIWHATKSGGCSNDVLVLQPHNGIDSKFLYYALSDNNFFDYAVLTSKGTKMPRGDKNSIMEYTVPSLPSSAQTAIANTLQSLDAKIELNQKINHNLEQQAQAIFKSWFVDFEPFRDGEFVDSELGPIPKGWRVGKLQEIGSVIGGATPLKAKPEFYIAKGTGIAWITPKDLSINKNKFISHGELDITEAGYKGTSTTLMPKGSVLFSSRDLTLETV